MSIDLTVLATGALSLTIALAWNRALIKAVEGHYPAADKRASAKAALVAALFITLVVIVVVELLNRAHRRLARRAGPSGGSRPPLGPLRFGESASGGHAPAAFEPHGPERAAPRACSACSDCAHCYPREIVRLWDD